MMATTDSFAKADSDRQSPMSQLRSLRDLQRRVKRLTAGRDTLIREAAEMGCSERQIAEAAGLSQPRVHAILIKVEGGES